MQTARSSYQLAVEEMLRSSGHAVAAAWVCSREFRASRCLESRYRLQVRLVREDHNENGRDRAMTSWRRRAGEGDLRTRRECSARRDFSLVLLVMDGGCSRHLACF